MKKPPPQRKIEEIEKARRYLLGLAICIVLLVAISVTLLTILYLGSTP